MELFWFYVTIQRKEVVSMKGAQLTENKWVQFLFTCMFAIIGGAVFQLIHIPLPWLLGSMVFVLIGSKLFTRIKPYWPGVLRNTGMGIIGYTIGLSFTLSTLKEIGKQLPSMVLLTVLLLLFTLLITFIVSKLSGISFPTALIGSIPGGLSQMIPLAEEIKGVDLTVVTFLQVSRLMMIIFCVPLLIFSPMMTGLGNHSLSASTHSASASWAGLFPNIWLFIAVCTLLALLAKKINFPTAFLLGPMIGTIALNIAGFHGPDLPTVLMNGTQLMLGGYIGLLLKPESLKNAVKISATAVLSGIVLILCALALSVLLTIMHPVSFVTAFLSLSPGGMDQMAIIAKEVHGDLSILICYQLFRALFISVAVPPLLKAAFKKYEKWKSAAN